MADPNDPYAAEQENLGPLRFMYSVPFGPQMAAAAQAAGAYTRGDNPSFTESYKFHRSQNDAALQAMKNQASNMGWDLASQIPYIVSGPAGAAAYAATSSATRGEPIHEAAMQAALQGTPSMGPSAPTVAAPIKLPGGGTKPFPEFEEVKKGFRIPGGSIHETGPYHDVTKLPEPYNNPDLADFVDDGFILTGMKAPIQQKGFHVTGGQDLPEHFVKRADFNNPDKTRPEAWGLPSWEHLTGAGEGARGTAANEPVTPPPTPERPGKLVGKIHQSSFAGEPGFEGETPSAMGEHLDTGRFFTVPEAGKLSPLEELIGALNGVDPEKRRAAKEAIDSIVSSNPFMTSPDDPAAWFNRPMGTQHPLADPLLNRLKTSGRSAAANEPMNPSY